MPNSNEDFFADTLDFPDPLHHWDEFCIRFAEDSIWKKKVKKEYKYCWIYNN